ncbi:hypothetical protein CBR_g53706 [Chara braunii]|uniref:Myb/SANT-like DNA-binding domain-containing protein n=1 Tax=Chara braunii TaxID=69332 RepID=A0A388MB75_CHABU|nr:hypothetical protein CBR_g53706 [Chara braunii]|eukprot:GBG91816.1 hypothetical protein CBR_g53706 [Chara braunii]
MMMTTTMRRMRMMERAVGGAKSERRSLLLVSLAMAVVLFGTLVLSAEEDDGGSTAKLLGDPGYGRPGPYPISRVLKRNFSVPNATTGCRQGSTDLCPQTVNLFFPTVAKLSRSPDRSHCGDLNRVAGEGVGESAFRGLSLLCDDGEREEREEREDGEGGEVLGEAAAAAAAAAGAGAGACADAGAAAAIAAAAATSGFPLAIFSPGFMLSADLYFGYGEILASWGYVVVVWEPNTESVLNYLTHRLPLLLLVALLLLIVVVFHICFLGRVPGRKQTRRMPKRSTKMDKLQTKTTMSVGGGGSSRQRCNSAEGGRRPYDPTLYSHLPSHEIPLPPSDDDVDDPRSSTVPLGSGSTQDWMGSQVYRHASTPTYIGLLEGRTPAGYDAGLVDLSFGLRSGSGEGLPHTVVVNPASASKHTSPSVRAAGPADSHGFVSPRRVALSTASVAASRTKTAGLAGCRTTTLGGAIDGEGDDDERDATKVVGRQFWDDERQRLRSTNTVGITRGVVRISVGAENEFEDCGGGGGEEITADDGRDDNNEDDDGEMEICPVGRKRGGSTTRTKVRESCKGGKGKKCGEESWAGNGTKSRDFWTVEHMIALIIAKRDQDSHLAGLGHNYGRMKTKTWKWEDVEKRLVQMGVTSRKAVDCGKKWDNLYQQFKSVHKFMGESGKPNFFTLTPGERRERGFDFRMDERVYSEMKAMSGGDHTIHPTNLADTGAPGGVQLSGAVGGRNKSGGSDVGGGGSGRRSRIDEGFVVLRRWRWRGRQSKECQTEDLRGDGGRHEGARGADVDDGGQREQEAVLNSDEAMRHSGERDSRKAKRNSGSGDAGETQKGRGHVPKSKRPRYDDDNFEHSGDLHVEEESMVDAQGANVMKRMGFGRDGVSREQLAALKQGFVGGVAVSLARNPKAAGIVMTDARVERQVPPKVGQVAARPPIPALQAGTSGVDKTSSAQKVDTTAGGGRMAAADNTTGSGVAEAAEEGRVDDVSACALLAGAHTGAMRNRALVAIALIDWAFNQSQNVTSSPIYQKIDPSKGVFAAGHSAGGKTSALAAQFDKAQRILGVVGVDPVDCSPPFQSCAPAECNYQKFYTADRVPSWQVLILKSGHMSFCNGTVGLPGLACKKGTVSVKVAIELSSTVLVALAEASIRNADIKQFMKDWCTSQSLQVTCLSK